MIAYKYNPLLNLLNIEYGFIAHKWLLDYVFVSNLNNKSVIDYKLYDILWFLLNPCSGSRNIIIKK